MYKEAAIWAVDEYERRTKLIAKGASFQKCIGWLHPVTRVGWHEVCDQFNWRVMSPDNNHAEFKKAFHKELKKRDLWKVFKGQEKSDQWLERKGATQ